ncbi:MAG: DUF2997 domain-containing protein [Pirellulales bacterium]
MSKILDIIVTPQGKVSVQTLGFTGSSCRDASKFLEQALGQRVGEHLTAEFHQVESARQSRQERA